MQWVTGLNNTWRCSQQHGGLQDYMPKPYWAVLVYQWWKTLVPQWRPLHEHEYTSMSPCFLKAYTFIAKLSLRAFKRYMTHIYRRIISAIFLATTRFCRRGRNCNTKNVTQDFWSCTVGKLLSSTFDWNRVPLILLNGRHWFLLLKMCGRSVYFLSCLIQLRWNSPVIF